MLFFFFFNDTATTEIYTLSLHDALPISARRRAPLPGGVSCRELLRARDGAHRERVESEHPAAWRAFPGSAYRRSEEHTSELQSRLHLVCRLLLEKKKKTKRTLTANTL